MTISCVRVNTRIRMLGLLAMLTMNSALIGQTSSFTFQGKLNVGGVAANSSFDMQFKLFDTPTDPGQIGSTVTVNSVQAVNGIFSVDLDFGAAAFPGPDRFLEIAVGPAGLGNFTTLLPRQKLGSSPYSIRAGSSSTADNALNLGGIPANQFVQTSDPRMSDARTPLPGSNDYVQNGTSAQAGINFNIGGTGTANVLDAGTQFNLNWSRLMSAHQNGLFIGFFSGGPTSSTGNVFVGNGAGMRTGSAGSNTFLGQAAGRENVNGGSNTFVGFASGINNLTGSDNTFIGSFAGNPDPLAQVSNSIAIGNNARVSQSNSIAIGNNVAVSDNNTIALGSLGHKTVIDGRFRTGQPSGVAAGDLPGRGYMETFFLSSIFQGVYTPNVIFGSFTSNPRNAVQACVHFQGIPGQTAGVILTNCLSPLSSVRDKTDVQSYSGGLEIVKRLKPVAFKFKENGMTGIGLNTEDVAEIDPSLVQRDENLKVEKVDERSLKVLFINAFKQQQTQIEKLQKQIDALRTLICKTDPQIDICKEIN